MTLRFPATVAVRDWHFDEVGFACFKNRYRDARAFMDDRKLAEYFISEQYLQFRYSDLAVDVAAQDCPYADYMRKMYGCRMYRQDLYYILPGVSGWDIGSSASHLPFLDNSVDKITLHNSLEHFEGDSDTGFVREAARVLKRGGMVCVVPLFIAEQYSENADSGWTDENNVKHLWGMGARFSRIYDMEQFMKRIVEPEPRLLPAVYFPRRAAIEPCFLVLTKI